MKKIVLLISFALVSLFASSGEDIYKMKCASCHLLQKPQNKSQMKAPPMPMVSKRLKMLKDREAFIEFVQDYIESPSRAKGFCMSRAFDRFGVMPAVGRDMSKEDRVKVATWLYDNFESTGDCYRGEGGKRSCASGSCCSSGCGGKK
jgi:hypothetical protein